MKNKFIVATLVSSVLMTTFTTSIVSGADAGSNSDPLVARSYVDSKIAELKTYIDTSIASAIANINSSNNNNTDNNNTTTTPSSSQYTVVPVSKGQTIIGGEGTEMILRSGRATVVSTTSNGLVDMTTGIDALANSEVQKNHLMIVPRNDGRGFKVTTDNTNVMIRGNYEIR